MIGLGCYQPKRILDASVAESRVAVTQEEEEEEATAEAEGEAAAIADC